MTKSAVTITEKLIMTHFVVQYFLHVAYYCMYSASDLLNVA